jgi:hypothetical protein
MDGKDLLYGIPQSEIEKIEAEGVSHKNMMGDMKSDSRVILTIKTEENYKENPDVIDLLSKGYVLKKENKLVGSIQLVFEK